MLHFCQSAMALNNTNLWNSTSFETEFLITNTPLKETINVCIDTCFGNTSYVKHLTKEPFKILLALVTLDSFFSAETFKTKKKVSYGFALSSTPVKFFHITLNIE